MRMETNTERYDGFEQIFDGVQECPVDTEYTLPDYCADIQKILKCIVTPEVTSVSAYGQNSGSMANYSVELKLAGGENLLSGMNGSAVIETQRAQDVIIIPVEAIGEDAQGEYVYVSASGDTEGKDKQIRRIETGIADADYTEVKNGLNAGEKVVYVHQGQTMMDQLMSMREQMMNGGSK